MSSISDIVELNFIIGFVIIVSDTSSNASTLYPIHAFIVEFLIKFISVKVSILNFDVFITVKNPTPQYTFENV